MTFKDIVIDGNHVGNDNGAINISGDSHVVLDHVEIKNHDNTKGNTGGVVFVNTGELTIEANTTIQANSTSKYHNTIPSSIIVITNGGTVVMTGGLITNNEIKDGSNGNIVFVQNDATFRMTGGKITGNLLNGNGTNTSGKAVGNAAVFKRTDLGGQRYEFGGTAFVYDNKNLAGEQRNVFLKNTKALDSDFLYLVEALGGDAKIGVFSNLMPDTDHPIVELAVGDKDDGNPDGYTALSADADYIFSDNDPTVQVKFNKGNDKIVLGAVAVDKSVLEAKVVELDGEGLNESAYTPTSWQVLQDALTAANEVLNDPDATQQEVDDARSALTDARAGLEAALPPHDAPFITGYTVNDEAPDQLVLTFDSQITLNDASGFSLTSSEGDVSVTGSVYRLSEDGQTLTLTLNRAVIADEALALSYSSDEGSIRAEDGGLPLASFTGKPIKNQVKPAQPTGKLSHPGLQDKDGADLVLNPTFDPDYEGVYKSTVPYATSSVSIAPLSAETGTSQKIMLNDVEVSSDDWSNLPLRVGVNTIEVTVYDQDDKPLMTYTFEITRQSAPDAGGGGIYIPVPSSGAEPQSGPIATTSDGEDVLFATGEETDQGIAVHIDSDQLQDIFDEGQGHQLAISVEGDGDVQLKGLTAGDLRRLQETGSSLTIQTPDVIYPVPESQLDLSALAQHFGDVPLDEIEVDISIEPSPADHVQAVKDSAEEGKYELLIDPVHVNMTFSHDGKSVQLDRLTGYAPKSFALPEGIDPNRITTGVITYPDGTVFHVPTVVTKINDRYYAQIHDLLSHGHYSVIWNPKSFSDVENHWSEEAANDMGARLVIEGIGGNLFAPDRNVSRAEFSAFVSRGLGLMHQDVAQNIFLDVFDTTWYHDPVTISSEFGIVFGYGDDSFRGNEWITREQGIAMIARAYRLIAPQQELSASEIAIALARFKDHEEISSWAQADAALLISLGIVQGDGQQNLNPQDRMTRAEAAALVQRILKHTGLIN